jgi:NAD(P)-dependent dehydrogenase (short-subunit alcohol dehydrogenase family)
MQGKICLITGGNSGIGKMTAIGLARAGATVVIVCRDAAKGEAALAEIKSHSHKGSGSAEMLVADLSSQAEVRRIANEFRQKYERLDVLVNNAGLTLGKRIETVDGYETTFAVSHLAHFALTLLLIDRLKASAPARIINVTSEAEASGTINFDDLQLTNAYNSVAAYSQSKLANVLFTYELARRLPPAQVTANCVHPGNVRTNFGRDLGGVLGAVFLLWRPFMRSAAEGAKTSIYLAASPEVAGVTGKYFVDSKETPSSPQSHDEAVARRLWDVSLQLA